MTSVTSEPVRSTLVSLLLLLASIAAAGCEVPAGVAGDDGEHASPGKADQHDGGETLDVWTWNLENFPHAAGAPEAVAEILESNGADIVGLQEIDDTDGLDATLDALDGWGGFPGQPGFGTQVAIAYRRDVVKVVAIEDLFTDDPFAFPRPPLAVTFELRGAPELGSITVVVVHLKAQIDAESQMRRAAAIEKLEAWIYDKRRSGDGAILAIGDFNDEIGDAASDNVFAPMLDRPRSYVALTEALDEAGAFSYIPFRRLIDHAVATRELAERLPPIAAEVLELDESIPGYERELSDHRPVVTTHAIRH